MKTSRILLLIGVLLMTSVRGVYAQDTGGYEVGDLATDFKLQSTDGSVVSLADYDDVRGYLVIFTCNSCPYAVAYEDRIIALDKEFKEKGVPVIAINPNNPKVQPKDSFEEMKKRAAEKGFTFPYLLDAGQKIFPQYGATRTPHCFLLEKTDKGNVVRYNGAIDDNYQDASAVETTYVANAIEAMLAGEAIKVENTKAIGCSIKI
ncbi:thioredoxin family protein [Robertkochia sediminum]|uniref:thioredoxin family protein n=1 Tax=Robertkochia sediminum TaxID=2785326 RepID=UPI001931C6D6|nr:thioredoxin family protein [Robertkochia sediminum]MBL7471611.1 thioredoxin family protein [Robertkochia sediminum]